MSAKCNYSNKFIPLATSYYNDVVNVNKDYTEQDFINWISENFEGDPKEIFKQIVGRYPIDKTRSEYDEVLDVDTKSNTNVFDRDNDTLKTHYRGHITEYNSMIRDFKDAIIERSIFDKHTNQWKDATKRDPNNGSILNNSIAEYKLNLVNDILKYLNKPYTVNHRVHITNGIVYDNNEILNLNDEIKLALLSFENEVTTTTGEAYQKALNAYVILSHFNELLKSETPFIQLKPEYQNSNLHDVDMYDYVGPNVQFYTGWSQTADVSIDEQTSDLLKILLDYFPEVSDDDVDIPNSSISQAGFNSAMTSLKNALFYDPELSQLEEELYKGAEMNLGKVIDTYLNYIKTNNISSSYRTFLTNKLRGIGKYIFNNNIDPAIKSMFIAQFNKTVGIKYRTYKTNYDTNALGGSNLKEQLVNVQAYNLQDTIKGAIKVFSEDQDYFQQVLDSYNIKIDPDDMSISILDKYKIDLKRTDTNFGVKYTFTKTGNLTSNELRNLISDLTSMYIPSDFESIGKELNPSITSTTWNETAAFTPVIALVLMGAYNSGKTFEFNKDKYDLIKFNNYIRDLSPIAQILSVIYGADTVNVIKDSRGNNLPLYKLISLVYNWPQITHDMIYDRNRFAQRTGLKLQNIYDGNILFNNRKIVGSPVTRSEVRIKDRAKSPAELTVAEVMRVSILYDFYQELKDKTGHLYLQNTTFSDKVNHLLQDYDINATINGPEINGKTSYTLKELIEPALRSGNTNALVELYYKLENDKITRLVDNITEVYNHVFGEAFSTLQEIDDFLADKTETYIKAAFRSKHVPLAEEIYYTVRKKKINGKTVSRLGINETMLAYAERFNDLEKTKLFIKQQKRYFIHGLVSEKFSLNVFTDKSLTELAKDYPTWVDKNSGNMKFYRLLDKDNNEVYVGANIDKILDHKYKLELHPVFDTYLLTDGLLSTQYNSLLTGEVWSHPNKNSDGLNDDLSRTKQYDEFSEANRLIAQSKRATIYGATVHPFVQSLIDGVEENIKVAVMKDVPGSVFTIIGNSDEIDSMDGSGFSSIYQAIFENNSLLDAKVALDKKTIMHSMNSLLGLQQQLKWAVYAITNERRRKSWNSDIRLEDIHQKMHNFEVNLSNVDLDNYLKSLGKDLYFKDWKTSKYYKIIGFSQPYLDKETETVLNIDRTIIEVNKSGQEIPNAQPIVKPLMFTSIYDIDQALGGAWAMVKKPNQKNLDFTDENNYLTSKIISKENLKKDMISYVVNKSAVKVGATNVNSVEAWNNVEPLQYMDFSTKFGGVQMNADHELDYAEVTEMSQMISAFIQNGYTKYLTLQAYREIGEVAADSIKRFKDKIKANDRDAVYRLLGEALIKSFNSGDKDTLGLAQAFVQEAEKSLKNANLEYKLPFSAATVRGAFIATVTSTLNKKSIRRKYEGLAGVLTPSHDIMQYYQLNGNTYTFEEFADYLNTAYRHKQYVNYTGEQISPIEYLLNNTEDNSLIELMYDTTNGFSERNNIEFEDSLIVEILDPKTNTTYKKRIKVDTFAKYEDVKYNPNIIKIWKDNTKGRNLKGQELYFTIIGNNGKEFRFSTYDLDSVRASQYIYNAIQKERALTDKEIAVIQRCTPTTINGKAKTLETLLKDVNAATQRILTNLQTKKIIPMQLAFTPYVSTTDSLKVNNIISKPAQLLVGRRYAKQFGLRHGDSLAAILSDRNWFFKRMRDEYTIPQISKQDICDVVLYNQDGKRLIVKFASNDEFNAIINDSIIYDNDSFRTVGDIIFYNGKELGNTDGKKTFKYIDPQTQEEFDGIVLNNPDNLNELLNTGMFDLHRYNYTEANYEKLVKLQFGEETNIELQTAPKNVFTEFVLTDPNIVEALILDEQYRFESRLQTASKNKYDAFKKSLQFVGARIPTQNMQSFTAFEVVGFTDSDTNDVYIPKQVTYLEGSDYVVNIN